MESNGERRRMKKQNQASPVVSNPEPPQVLTLYFEPHTGTGRIVPLFPMDDHDILMLLRRAEEYIIARGAVERARQETLSPAEPTGTGPANPSNKP